MKVAILIGTVAIFSIGVARADDFTETSKPIRLVYSSTTGPVLPYRELRCQVTATHVSVVVKTIEQSGESQQYSSDGDLFLNKTVLAGLAAKVAASPLVAKPGIVGAASTDYELLPEGADKGILLKATGDTVGEHPSEEARKLVTFLDLICGE